MFGMNYPGDESFQGMLKAVNCPMPLWRIKTTLLGSVAATEMVKPSQFLPMIWHGKEPEFNAMDQAQEFFGILMGLWNELAELQSGGRYPLWLVKGEKNLENFSTYLKIRREELMGFRRGLDAGATDPEEMTEESLKALAVLAKVDGFLEVYEKLVEKDQDKEAIIKAIAMMPSLDQMIQDSFETIIKEQKRLRAQEIAKGTFPVGGYQRPKIGRNVPCLCGSGKKFKKCCGK